jgi:hypothetical protein
MEAAWEEAVEMEAEQEAAEDEAEGNWKDVWRRNTQGSPAMAVGTWCWTGFHALGFNHLLVQCPWLPALWVTPNKGAGYSTMNDPS